MAGPMDIFDESYFGRPDVKYYQYKGIWLSESRSLTTFTFSRRAVEEAVQLELDETDVLITTYPKTGQTWTMAIINLILYKEATENLMQSLMKNTIFLETELLKDGLNLTGAQQISMLPRGQRIIKTHLPYVIMKESVERNSKVRGIMIIRDPKDTYVSYYHHFSSDASVGQFKGTWDEFFKLIKAKALSWSDYHQHVADWYKYYQTKDKDSVLILRYEEMKKNPKENISKIARFLGKELSDTDLDLVVEKSSFSKMSKEMNSVIKAVSKDWKTDRSNFARKGEVGDWKNYFNDEQKEYIDGLNKEFLEPLGIFY